MRKQIVDIIGLLLILLYSFNLAAGGDTASDQVLSEPGIATSSEAENENLSIGIDRVNARLAGEVWIGDPGYGHTIQSAIAAIGSKETTLRVPAGSHVVSDKLTIPDNISIRFARGAALRITIPNVSIAGLTKSNPCRVTWTMHGLNTGDKVYIGGITQAEWCKISGQGQEVTSVNPSGTGRIYTITKIDSHSFSIPVDTSGFSTAYNPWSDPGIYTKLITINGGVEAGRSKIFMTGFAKIDLSDNKKIKTVFPDWWGAYNDGSHAIETQQALQAMFNTKAHSFYLPCGTYLCADRIEIEHNCVVWGDGPSSVIKAQHLHNTSYYEVHSGILCVKGSNVTIKDLKILGQWTFGTGTNTHGVYFTINTIHGIVRNSVISGNGYCGIFSEGNYMDFSHNFIDTSGVDGIEARGSHFLIANNHIEKSGLGKPGVAGIEIGASRGISEYNTVVNNIIINVGSGVYIGAPTSFLTIEGNIIQNFSVRGVEVIGRVDNYISGVVLANNLIANGTSFDESLGWGIAVGPNVKGFTITGNLIKDLPKSIGICLQGKVSDGIIASNLVAGCKYGLGAVQPTIDKIQVVNNNLQDNATALNFNQGDKTNFIVKGNMGWNPQGSRGFSGGEPPLPGSGKEFVNSYWCDCLVSIYGGTVTEISIGKSPDHMDATGQTGGTFVVAAGSYVRIIYSSAPKWKWYGL